MATLCVRLPLQLQGINADHCVLPWIGQENPEKIANYHYHEIMYSYILGFALRRRSSQHRSQSLHQQKLPYN